MTDELNQKESTLIEWQAPEFFEFTRSWKWFLTSALVTICIVGYSIYSRDIFIVFLAPIIFAFTVYTQKIKPKKVNYRLTEIGLYVNEILYSYNEIHSFWLVMDERLRILNIMFNKKYLPGLNIIFTGVDPLLLKSTLLKYIPEQEERGEQLVDKLARILKI